MFFKVPTGFLSGYCCTAMHGAPAYTGDDIVRLDYTRKPDAMKSMISAYGAEVGKYLIEKGYNSEKPLCIAAESLGAHVAIELVRWSETHAPGMILYTTFINPAPFGGVTYNSIFDLLDPLAFWSNMQMTYQNLQRHFLSDTHGETIEAVREILPEHDHLTDGESVTTLLEVMSGQRRLPKSITAENARIISGTHDTIVPPALAKRIADTTGLPLTEVDGDHEMMLKDMCGTEILRPYILDHHVHVVNQLLTNV